MNLKALKLLKLAETKIIDLIKERSETYLKGSDKKQKTDYQ